MKQIKKHKKSFLSRWLKKLQRAIQPTITSRQELISFFRQARNNKLIDADTLSMLESVLILSNLQARDIMIPKQQMAILSNHTALPELIEQVRTKGHSRFPVVSNNKEEILGILHAKDILDYYPCSEEKKFDVTDILRPATIIPESKRLNVLLSEFRSTRNHMAIVVDEYGVIAGFITIEDIIEQIVGDIEDEFDKEEDAFIKQHKNNKYIIKAHIPLQDFNQYFNLSLQKPYCDTLGGLVAKVYGHLPRPNEVIEIDGYRFKILNADNRRIKLIEFLNQVKHD
jgi:magnesium and cobalt transporter